MYRPLLFAVCLLFGLVRLFASPYPVIATLDGSDPLFRQLQSDIESFHIAQAHAGAIPSVTLYSYRPTDSDDLLSVAARLNTGIQTIVTLNANSLLLVF